MSKSKSQATLQQQGGKGNLKRNPGKMANAARSNGKAGKGKKGC